MITEQTGFQNIGIDILQSQIEDIEELKYTPIEASYWKLILLRYALLCCFVAGVIIILENISLKNYIENRYFLWIILFVFLIAYLILLRVSFLKKSYAIRTHDIVYKHGVLSNSITIVPIDRIQHVKVTESFLMRFFNLAAFDMFTAAGIQNGTIRIPGLKSKDAQRLRVFLISKIKDQNDGDTIE
ncbi:MAG TPA: PH domain-containing protein [Edaphocola sp.]|nr:PH domain-containing protein [Edaphocola sp.]